MLSNCNRPLWCSLSEKRLRMMKRRRRQHLLAVCVLMVVAGGFLKSRVSHTSALQPVKGRMLLHVVLQVSSWSSSMVWLQKRIHVYECCHLGCFIVFELPFCSYSKCPSAASENCLSVGQHWNRGLPTGAAVFCHSLYLQDPQTLQSSKWQTIHLKSCYCSNKVPSVICILPFSAMDIKWPTLPFSLDCCAHWLVSSTLQPYSSVTLSLDFLWERCHGFCHQQAVGL